MKARESEVNEIAEEKRLSLGGPLALMSKVTSGEAGIEATENEGSEDEGMIVNFDDEVVAFYSNNKVNKFFKKPFNLKSKTSESKGIFSGKSVREEKKVGRRKLNLRMRKLRKS